MQNGHDKTVQIIPAQAAAFALEFLSRAAHTQAERERFDIGVGLLSAIMNGQVTVAQAANPEPLVQQATTQ